MARYLSAEWVDAVGAAAAASEELREACAGIRLTIQQRVTGANGDAAAYHVVVDDGTVTVRPGEAEAPDVTFAQDRATAVAVATGEVAAQTAFMNGDMRVTGDVQLLMEHRDALAGLDRALAGVRAATDYR